MPSTPRVVFHGVRQFLNRSMAILSAGLLVIGLTLLAPPARALTTPAIPWDLNGDGYAELAIGAWGEKHRPDGSPTLLLEVGRVTLFRGTATGPTTTGIRKISTWVTPGEFAYFGRALTSCDFDADGYADMAIGALGLANPGNTDSRGTVNVMYGSATGPVDAGRQVLRALDFGRGGTWGGPLACGDLNEDGFADLAIGVNTCCDQPQWVTVIYGSSSGLDVDEFVHLDELDAVGGDPADVRGGYGRSVTIGDLDNDGADDLVVGANAGGPFSGVFAHYGDDGGIASEATTIIRPDTPELINSFPNSEWNEIGHETAIGDFNGDGDGDLAIGGGWRLTGCERENSDLPCPGLVAVIPTTAIGLNLGSVKVWHPGTSGVAGQTQATYDRFGTALASGRLNSDSRDDLAIGAPYKNVGATLAGGGVTVLYGSSTGLTATNSQIWVQSSPGVPGIDEPGDLFGSDLLISRLRGSNGSGLSIGINNEDVGQADNAGAVTVLLSESGGLSATGSKTWSESSPGVPGLAVEGDHFNTVS